MSFTYHPKRKKRSRTHGFLNRMSKTSGRKLLSRRRKDGRRRLAV